MNVNPILKQVLINGFITHSAARGVKRGSTWLGYGILAGGIGFIALVYFSIAGYGLLSESFSSPLAAAIIGGVMSALAGIVGVTGYMSYKGKFQKAPPKNNEGIFGSIENGLQSVLGGLEEPIRDNPKLAMLAAALAGFAAADKLGDVDMDNLFN
jgi:hypothetical protein